MRLRKRKRSARKNCSNVISVISAVGIHVEVDLRLLQ